MKYYKINPKTTNDNGRISSSASVDNVPKVELELEKIRYGLTYINDFSIIDSFYLESFDNEDYWEDQLNDLHPFIGKAKVISGWLISAKLKQLLSDFKISEPHHFYKSELLFRKKKYDYYIFQFTGKLMYKELTKYINFSKSEFFNPATETIVSFKNIDDYSERSEELYFEKDTDFIKKKIVLNSELDFYPMQSFFKDNLVSKRLKLVIEENDITGLEFSELDYEIVV